MKKRQLRHFFYNNRKRVIPLKATIIIICFFASYLFSLQVLKAQDISSIDYAVDSLGKLKESAEKRIIHGACALMLITKRETDKTGSVIYESDDNLDCAGDVPSEFYYFYFNQNKLSVIEAIEVYPWNKDFYKRTFYIKNNQLVYIKEVAYTIPFTWGTINKDTSQLCHLSENKVYCSNNLIFKCLSRYANCNFDQENSSYIRKVINKIPYSDCKDVRSRNHLIELYRQLYPNSYKSKKYLDRFFEEISDFIP